MRLSSKQVEQSGDIKVQMKQVWGLGGDKIGYCIYSRTATARIRRCTDHERKEQDPKL